MESDSDSDGSWEQLCREIDEFVFSDPAESEAEEESEKSEPEETPVYGATLQQLDALWGEGRWKVTAMHLADYIAFDDYLPVEHCCGQIHD